MVPKFQKYRVNNFLSNLKVNREKFISYILYFNNINYVIRNIIAYILLDNLIYCLDKYTIFEFFLLK